MENFDGKERNVSFLSEQFHVVLNDNLEFWMTKLPLYLRTVPIIHLAIPGSHNTMTYTIGRYNDVGPDEPKFIQCLGRYLSLVSKPVIFNWSVTQYDDVVAQLNGGIRYLDLRLATKPTGQEIYFLHGLYGDEVTEHFQTIARWLRAHPKEVIILDFQHFYSFTGATHTNLIRKIKTIFGGMLCPIGNLSSITCDWLARRRFQVIVIYGNEVARSERELWPSGLWPTPWPDTTNVAELEDFLDTRLKTRLPDTGFVSQCLLTPDVKYVTKHLCGSLHRDLARPCRAATFAWLQRHFPGGGGMNIVITDYVSFNNFQFPKAVIQRNAEMLFGESVAGLGVYLKEKTSMTNVV